MSSKLPAERSVWDGCSSSRWPPEGVWHSYLFLLPRFSLWQHWQCWQQVKGHTSDMWRSMLKNKSLRLWTWWEKNARVPTALCRSQELNENPKVWVTVKHLQRQLAVTFVQSGASRCQTLSFVSVLTGICFSEARPAPALALLQCSLTSLKGGKHEEWVSDVHDKRVQS